jgi:enolase-phosphatase E1
MPSGVLLDVEGTTTALSFVHDRLFPLSREAVGAWVRAHWQSPETREARTATGAGTPEDLATALRAWIDADRKETSLKAIQGSIWREAYEAGALRGHVYDDVPAALRRWTGKGARVAVFSSGSVEAQQLLFRHSDHGDLTRHLHAHFDTSTGPKREPSSYRAIARTLDLAPPDLLFLSDVQAELDAAREAGLSTVQVARPGVAIDARCAHRCVHSFDELP